MFRDGYTPNESAESQRFTRSCGWELSRAISHLWSNSASNKCRLSRVSDRWERASVYLKRGAGTSRDFLIAFVTGTGVQMLDPQVSPAFEKMETFKLSNLYQTCLLPVYVPKSDR